MKKRWMLLVASSVLAGSAVGAGRSGTSADRAIAARAALTTTPTVSETTTPTIDASGTPQPLASGTPHATPTFVPARTPVHQPTPIAPPTKHITLPKPIVVEIGTSLKSGLTQKNALLLANKAVPQFLITLPTYVPKNWTLQWIHVDPPQDQQTPPLAWLQYYPTGLTTTTGKYPTYTLFKQLKNAFQVNPGQKPVLVDINGIKGSVVDLKLRNGNEIVTISWNRVTVGYQITSNVTLSKLSVADLVKIAKSFQ